MAELGRAAAVASTSSVLYIVGTGIDMFEQVVNLAATVGTLKRELAPILGVAPPHFRLFRSNDTRNGPSGEPLVADRALSVEGLRDSDAVFVEDARPAVAGAFSSRPCRLVEVCPRACARSRPRARVPLPPCCALP